MKLLRCVKAFVAGLMLLGSAGVAMAGDPIPGTWVLNGTGSSSDGPGAWTTLGGPAGNRRFFPDASIQPLLFGDIGWLSMEFQRLPSSTTTIGGGSPRVTFIIDNDYNGTEDGRIITQFGFHTNIGFSSPVGWQDTGNLLGKTQAPPLVGEFERVDGGASITPNSSGFYTYTTFIDQVGTTAPHTGIPVRDYHVLNFFIANDTTGLDISYRNVVLEFAPIPEPASMGLLAIGAGAMLLRRRKA